jgi:antitoxin Phd
MSSARPDPLPVPGDATWKLEDAKARFSEVVRLAQGRGPQKVTLRGRDAVVVLAAADYARLASAAVSPSLAALFAASPLARADRFDDAVMRERGVTRPPPDFGQ